VREREYVIGPHKKATVKIAILDILRQNILKGIVACAPEFNLFLTLLLV
jgi:hypothetical protein